MKLSDEVRSCCPFCGGDGFTVYGDSRGEQQQQQCRFCYEVTYPFADRIATLEAERDRLRTGINAVQALIAESGGVYGLHLNGDNAPWIELLAGGRYEDWLIAFSEALEESG